MAKLNDLLIVEMSSSQLSVAQSENKDYILEGIFGEIDSKNKNNRIYTEDEYVPQIQQLQDKIKSSKLLGELDHPQQFDVSLKNVSHIIEELYYDKDNKQVKGKIRLLDTDAGRQAKALVDAGVPLQISSRAAGAVESNGKVKIKQLFTYDLVADPGFANAELKRVNESYGFDNESGLWIYEMNGEGEVAQEITETNIETNNNKNMAEFVKAEDFHKYSEYLAGEIKSIKESIDAKSEDTTLENVKSHNDHIVESVNTLSEYVEYLAGKLDESIQYTEHVAEKADQGISYTETVAEKLDQGIQYSEHLAEAIGKVKDFANYLAEAHNEGTDTAKNLLSYVEYLKENLQSVSEYAEYIATQINENLVTEEETEEVAEEEVEETEEAHHEEVEETEEVAEEDEAGEGAEEVVDEEDEAGEGAEEVVDEEDEAGEGAEEVVDEEEVAEEDEAGEGAEEVVDEEEAAEEVEETEEVTEDDDAEEPGQEKEDAEDDIEEIGDNSEEGDVDPKGDIGEPAEELEDETVKSDAEVEDETEEAEPGESEEEAEGEDGAHDPLESYKKEISSKLDALVEAAQVKENENPSFFKIVSATTQEKYNALNEDAKTEVRQKVAKRGFMTEAQINAIVESAEAVVESRNSEPFFITAMPVEYKEKFEALTEAKQNQIKAQANYHTLNTEYQVRNFWETRDLREVKVDLEKLQAVNESAVKSDEKKPLYDVSNYADSLKKRFKK
jgi:hypothetical protein